MTTHSENSDTLPISSTHHHVMISVLFCLLIRIMFGLCKLSYKLIRPSIIWNFVILLYDSFPKGSYFNEHDDMADSSSSSTTDPNQPAIGVYQWKPAPEAGSGEVEEECAVCLSKIEEGEEMRELRCKHHFHRVCLERWINGYKGVTCPLCRESLFLRKTVSGMTKVGVEAVELPHFKYCCFSTSGHRRSQRWWLR